MKQVKPCTKREAAERSRLMDDLEGMVEAHDIGMEATLEVLAAMAIKILCNEAPDRITADSWSGTFGMSVVTAYRECADAGDVVWSRVRAN